MTTGNVLTAPVDDPGGVIPVIHAVTNDGIVQRPDFLERAGGVMRALGERGAVHLRAHRLTGRDYFDLAVMLARLQAETGCWLVANDRLDVALAAGARAIQLTSRSMHVADAARIAPGLAIGASVHSASEAREASLAGAHWCVAGHVFSTPSHPGAEGRGTGFVRALSSVARIPLIAIGGVEPGHLARLRAAGAHGAAAIRGIWEASDAERAAKDYLTSYDAAGDGDGGDRTA